MSAYKTIWKKEFKDALRDKRSVLAAMSYAFFGPMLMAVAFFFLISQLTDPSDVEINIEGKQYAPELVEHLRESGIVERDSEWPAEVTPIELTIPEKWAENIASAVPVTVVLSADWSAQKQQTDVKRVEQALQAYSAQIANYRLILRGVDPRVIQPVHVAKQDMATRGSKAAIIMGSVLVFILLSVFWSGMNVAIDISAGERERNSLEFLLSQPVSSQAIVIGKVLAASCFALIGALLSLILIPVIFSFVPMHQIGMSVDFIPMAASFGVEFARLKTPLLYYLPLTGQHQTFLSLIRGEAVNWFGTGISALLTLVSAVLLTYLIGRMLKSEKTVFGL